MKRVLWGLVLFLAIVPSLHAQSSMKWRIGGQYGIGATYSTQTKKADFTMNMGLGCDLALGQSAWRAGLECGAISQGVADYFFEEGEPERFVRPNFLYAGAYADYGFHLGKLPFFVRGGIGPAQQIDQYIYHNEKTAVPFFITGAGLDLDYMKFMLHGYVTPKGDAVVTLSLGLYLGKQKKEIR